MQINQLIPVIKRFALSLCQNHSDADDLVQDVALKLVRLSPDWNDEETSNAWLFRIVINRYRDRLRWKKRRPEVSAEPLELVDKTDPQQIAEGREQLQNVLASFRTLPDTQRQVLYLRTVEDLTIQEISEVLEMSRNTVKVHLSHARKRLRNKFLKPSREAKL